jgi:hypothetical protein
MPQKVYDRLVRSLETRPPSFPARDDCRAADGLAGCMQQLDPAYRQINQLALGSLPCLECLDKKTAQIANGAQSAKEC